jgi:hypothetical protein
MDMTPLESRSRRILIAPSTIDLQDVFRGFGSLRRLGIQEISRRHSENACESIYHIDGRAVLAAFQRADIGAMDVGPVSKLLLGKASCMTQGTQI